ncbi:MAG: hypothetical protein WCE50_10825 [Candidatus Acidiferrum sp.]
MGPGLEHYRFGRNRFFGTLAATWTLRIIRRQTIAIESQVKEMKETGKQTDKLIFENIAQTKSLIEQSQSLAKSAYHLGESAAEARRSASAMEEVAKGIAISSQAARQSISAINQQMRAYLSVVIGNAVFQERFKGLKFEGKPTLVNTGNTPAKNVSYRAGAAIMNFPLPEDFAFPLNIVRQSTATIGAHQNAILSIIVDDFVDDSEVEDIKTGKANKCLFVWGVVTYDDIFGDHQTSKFCQSLFWNPNGTVYGFYYPKHNETT